jgi:hypothetical protein
MTVTSPEQEVEQTQASFRDRPDNWLILEARK